MSENTSAGQGAEPEAPVQPVDPVEVQPDVGVPEQDDASQTSQGLIEPYLKDVDPSVRDTVADVLERFRSEQDARVQEKLSKEAANRKQYEQYGTPEQVGLATSIVNSFLTDPVETTKWLFEQANDELGVDILSQILPEVQAQEQEQGTGDEPLTPSKVMELLEQRDQTKQQEQRRQQLEQQQAEQARQRALGWFEEAAARHNVSAEALPEGVVNSMFARANEIKNGTPGMDGQTAIDLAVAEFGKVLSPGVLKTPAPDPTVANGGSAPPAEPVNVDDPKQRQEAMLQRLNALTGTG